MKKQIKLLIFAKDIDGGTGTFLLNFLKIKELFPNNELIIKTIVLERPDFLKVPSNISFLKKREYEPIYSFSILQIQSFIRDFLWFKKNVNQFQPTTIISIDINCNIITEIYKFFYFKKIPSILATHIDLETTLNQKASYFVKIILKNMITFFYNRANILVAVSKDLSINLSRLFHLKKTKTIYNGIQIDNKNQIKNFTKSKKNTILSLSRLDEQKDHITIIKAFSLVQQNIPNSQLWIASDGPMKKELENYTKLLGISKKVKFLGWIKSVKSAIKKSDVFIFSSKREGFGYVLIEAMSQGKPVISTNTPHGPSEILDNGKYGVLVPVKNEVLMAKEIIQILKNKKKYFYFSKKAYQRSFYFSNKRMLREYKKIILNLNKS